MNGRHRRVDPNEPAQPRRDKRPAERLTDSEVSNALAWLLVAAEDPDIEHISAYFQSAYGVDPVVYVRRER